jgi:hypothetical protein
MQINLYRPGRAAGRRRQSLGGVLRQGAGIDVALAVAELEKRGFAFDSFKDPDGHTLALMQEAPKGYAPPARGRATAGCRSRCR